MLIEAIENYTKCDTIIIDFEEGYIDHQSFDVADKTFENIDTLIQFIFNKSSILYTDNDNH